MSWSMMKQYKADSKLHGGNMKGEGWIKGGVLVLGSREEGIIHAAKEEFGKGIEVEPIEKALNHIKGNKQQA